MRIAAVVARRTQAVDAIHAYAAHLVAALNARGEDARLAAAGDTTSPIDVTLVQYNPFSFGRWGLAPAFVAWALRAGFRPSSGKLVLMVHEPYVAVVDVRTLVMAAWQRPQLMILRLLATRVLAPSEAQALRCGTRVRRAHVVPVGSNLPDGRGARDASRRALGIGPQDVVLVSFAASPAGRRQDLIAAAASGVAARGRACALLVLGVDNVPPPGLPAGVRVVTVGHREDEELARVLAAGDIFLAPYVDGVSTRRTALMTALQHAMPVVGTVAARSDRVLVESAAIVAVPVDDAAEFGRATGDLAADDRDRARRGSEARALFEREFTWERIAERIVAQLS